MLPEQFAENQTTDKTSNKEATTLDINMPEIADLTSPKLGVFGVGGAGCNSVNNLISKNDLHNVAFVACNTDKQSLTESKADIKICLASEELGGLGTGKDARVGFEAARRSMPEIMEAIAPLDMVFVTAGMGGGTGTGAACMIAKMAKSMGKLVVAVVSKPFHFEQQFTRNLAQEGICALSEYVNALIVLENQQLQSLGNEQCTFSDIFKMLDDFTHNSISTVIDIIFSKGLINRDYNDIRSVLMSGGFATIISGYAKGENKIEQVVKEVTTNRLLDHNIRLQDASSVLISATVGPELPFADTQSLFTKIPAKLKISEDISIFYCGVNTRDDFDDTVRVSVIAAGVKIDNIENYKPIANLVSALRSVEIPVSEEQKTLDLFQEVNAKKALSDVSNLEATRDSLVYRTNEELQRPSDLGPQEEFQKEVHASNEVALEEKATPVIAPHEEMPTFADNRMEQIHQDLSVVNQKVQQQFLSEDRSVYSGASSGSHQANDRLGSTPAQLSPAENENFSRQEQSRVFPLQGSVHEERSREESPREERSREESPREERSREERPREESPREERSREESPREERSREESPREENLDLPQSFLAPRQNHEQETDFTSQSRIVDESYMPRRPAVAGDEEPSAKTFTQRVTSWLGKKEESLQENNPKETRVSQLHHTEVSKSEGPHSPYSMQSSNFNRVLPLDQALPRDKLPLSEVLKPPSSPSSEDKNDEWMTPTPVDLPQSLQRNLRQHHSDAESYENPSISVMKKQAQ